MACSRFFSFAEIVQGRDASVRVTDDGLLYAVDLVMVMTGLARDQSGLALRRLSDEVFQSIKLIDRQLSTHGGHKTKLVSFENALELIMVLPGKVAKETRKAFASIIHRYLAGDKSLITEIQANATSSSPIAQLARATLPEPEDPEARRKRIKREDVELVKLERESQELHIRNVQAFMGLMNTIRPDWMQTDARFRLQTEDMIKNIYSPVGLPAITNEPSASQTASLSISQLVQELGGKVLKHADACRAGALAAKRYRALHDDSDPPKHRQWVDGAERVVNSYTEDDRELLTGVLVDLGLVPEIPY
jgi:hypothetical protein